MKFKPKPIRIEDMTIHIHEENNDLQVCYNCYENKYTIILPENMKADNAADEVIRVHLMILSWQGFSEKEIKQIVKKQYKLEEHEKYRKPFWEYE